MRRDLKEAKSKTAVHFVSPQLFKIFFLISFLTLSLQPRAVLSQGRFELTKTESVSSTQLESNLEKKRVAGRVQSSSILNPNISVMGWFQGVAGNSSTLLDKGPGFQFREVELGFQSAVDPYFFADIFIAVHGKEVDLEEATLTTLALPYGFQAKLGKFHLDMGKFNRTHAPETPFADRPLAAQRFFGDEPLKVIGFGTSHLLPNPWGTYINVDAQVAAIEDLPVFTPANREDLLYLGRISAFKDLTESTNLNLGISYANGPNGFEVNQVNGSSVTRRNHLFAVDVTFRWKNPRRSINRSLIWQTEFYWTLKNMAPNSSQKRGGIFSYLDYQFSRRWHLGVRSDWVQRLDESGNPDIGGLCYLSFMPSEFSLVSLQGKHVKFSESVVENVGFLKVTFNIGPHGVHPF